MPSDFSTDQLIEHFANLGSGSPNIRLIAVIGSQVCVDRPADQWSDLDLLVVAQDPQPYLSASDWLAEIGPVMTRQRQFPNASPGRSNVS